MAERCKQKGKIIEEIKPEVSQMYSFRGVGVFLL